MSEAREAAEALSRQERAWLLRLARASVEQCVAGGDGLDRLLRELRPSPGLEAERGAFVTLHTLESRGSAGGAPGALRGCIGRMEGRAPLYREVIENARSSALSDPRFSPVRPEEIPALSIEVSVLTPLSPLPHPEDFRPGVDGIEIEMSGRRGVFLPQVATEQGWDAERTFEQLCRKAGLPPGSWRDPEACLFVFQAEVFGEGEEGMPPRGGSVPGG
jgi:AmmeMemoRadiSam system protein A